MKAKDEVVSYRNSTSNHNSAADKLTNTKLYLIEILHQTTTMYGQEPLVFCCILSKFYIKPQQKACGCGHVVVVSYRNSTSNHNDGWNRTRQNTLYLIEILHQTTTIIATSQTAGALYLIEILHQTTTQSTVGRNTAALYLIEILHQTTTLVVLLLRSAGCILSKFYIKPQPFIFTLLITGSCILSKFYIKPQRKTVKLCM